jgi:hypothetical protein
LRLVAIGQNRIEEVRSETGLGAMTALPMTIAKQGMQPPVSLASAREVIDQLNMAVAAAEQTKIIDLVQIEHGRMGAREPPKGMPQHLPAVRVINQSGDRQLGLADRHRGRQYQAMPQLARH